jgi:hypothetical protein
MIDELGWIDFLDEDESEAENLLDELNWNVTDGDHQTLHETLSSQSEALNMEIIDLLLQWEEMDDNKNEAATKTGPPPKPKQVPVGAGIQSEVDLCPSSPPPS